MRRATIAGFPLVVVVDRNWKTYVDNYLAGALTVPLAEAGVQMFEDLVRSVLATDRTT